jgi:hypothetical protein
MFIAPVVEEGDIHYYFSKRNVHTLTVIWARQNDYSNDNRLFLGRILKYKRAHNDFLSNWLAASDDRRMTMMTSYISNKHQGWYDSRTESKFHFCFFPSLTFIELTYDAMIYSMYGIDFWKVISIYIYVNAIAVITYWTLYVKIFQEVTTEIVLNRLSYSELFWIVVCGSGLPWLSSSICHIRSRNERGRENGLNRRKREGRERKVSRAASIILPSLSFFFSSA